MELSEAQVGALAGHIGYGNPKAKLWFVGSEEGLGGKMSDSERITNLDARSRWEPIMDMAEAHATLREKGAFINDLIDRPGSTLVWRFMARIARAFAGAPDYDRASPAADYVRHNLGRAGGETFLTELEPFPAARQQQPVELRDFANRPLLDELREKRRIDQLRILHRAQPSAVICYGPKLASRFQDQFGIKWKPLVTLAWLSPKGKLQEKDTWQAAIEYEGGLTGRAFLLPFFGQGQFSEHAVRQFVQAPEFQASRA